MTTKKHVRFPVQPWWWRVLHPRGKNTWGGFLRLSVIRWRKDYYLSHEKRLFVENHLLYYWDYVLGPIWNKMLTVMFVLLCPFIFVWLGILIDRGNWWTVGNYAFGAFLGACGLWIVRKVRDA